MFLRVYDSKGALKNTSANFSDAEIKTAYENNADTNEFSDDEKTKLASWTTGSGTPEGVVTAVVGSLYTRTDGGAGTTFYVKESGVGSTGWVGK